MRRPTTIIAATVLVATPAVGMAGPASAAAVPATAVVAQAPQPGTAATGDVQRTSAVRPAETESGVGCASTFRPASCRISEPIVNQPVTHYLLPFQPGDHVTVFAGGCVQTGGHGLTWKRYVDPASDNDLYHGLITIPGETRDLERLVNVVGRTFDIGPFGGGNLVLGYEDDGYSDNGYYAPDPGTGNQCLDDGIFIGNAYVEIDITSPRSVHNAV